MTPDQEPRTGGVPFISYRVRHDGPLRLVEWDAELNRPEQHTHTVFTRAQAEALIDPNDSELWVRVYRDLHREFTTPETYGAACDALAVIRKALTGGDDANA